MDKRELRKEILAKRNALLLEERVKKSMQIAYKVIGLKEFQKSKKVLLYAPIKSEVDTMDIFQKAKELGKDIYFPCVLGEQMEFFQVKEWNQLEVGTFGVREPKAEAAFLFAPEKEDKIFVLMPGAVFDEEGNRIGYGGGYYDKYLEKLSTEAMKKNICKVAIAFECQMVETGRIPKEGHDVTVDFVVTERNVYCK